MKCSLCSENSDSLIKCQICETKFCNKCGDFERALCKDCLSFDDAFENVMDEDDVEVDFDE